MRISKRVAKKKLTPYGNQHNRLPSTTMVMPTAGTVSLTDCKQPGHVDVGSRTKKQHTVV